MDDLIRFLLSISKLKTLPRRRWVLLGVPNPESVANHAYMVTLMAWVLGSGREFNMVELLKSSLAHCLDLVFQHSQEPFYQMLRENPASLYTELSKKSTLDKIIRNEEKSLGKILKYSGDFREEIRFLWEDFHLEKSSQGKFLHSVDILQNLFQALIYKDSLDPKSLESFWSEADREIKDERLLGFLESLKTYDQKGEKKVVNQEDLCLIKFLIAVSRLQSIKRVGWVYGGARPEETESIADHSFRLAIMCWPFSGKQRYNLERMIKMSLAHDLVTIYTGDITPFDNLVTGDWEKDKKILETWPSYSREEKEKQTFERRQKEREAFDKLLKDLPIGLQDEILSLWYEYEEGFSKEGRFVRQLDRVEKLLQAIEYNVKGIYKPEITPYWVQLKSLLDDPVLIEFVEEVDKSFYVQGAKRKFVDKLILES